MIYTHVTSIVSWLLLCSQLSLAGSTLQYTGDAERYEVAEAYAEKSNPSPNVDRTDQVEAEIAYLSKAQVQWLSWTNSAETESFTDLKASTGENYNRCGDERVAVGLRCQNKLCSTLSIFCASLMYDDDNPVSFSMQDVPNVGDAEAIAKKASIVGYVNDAINPNSRACPANTTINGVSCVDENCKFMGLYCAAANQNGQPVYLATPNPDRWDYYEDKTRSMFCSWESVTSSTKKGDVSNPAICPINKVLTGMKATGKNSRDIQIYCCPIYHSIDSVDPADILVTSSTEDAVLPFLEMGAQTQSMDTWQTTTEALTTDSDDIESFETVTQAATGTQLAALTTPNFDETSTTDIEFIQTTSETVSYSTAISDVSPTVFVEPTETNSVNFSEESGFVWPLSEAAPVTNSDYESDTEELLSTEMVNSNATNEAITQYPETSNALFTVAGDADSNFVIQPFSESNEPVTVEALTASYATAMPMDLVVNDPVNSADDVQPMYWQDGTAYMASQLADYIAPTKTVQVGGNDVAVPSTRVVIPKCVSKRRRMLKYVKRI